MKDLIRKILKEADESDEFEWARGIDVSRAQEASRRPWKRIRDNWDFNAEEIYDILVANNFSNLEAYDELADVINNQAENAYDSGRQSGHEDCDCEGCCDEYVYYEDARREVDEARDQGYEDGYETAERDLESKIDELKERISELESEIERLEGGDEE